MKTLVSFSKVAYSLLAKKYFITPSQFDANVITNIIYNEKLHVVSEFKEWLIYDDQNEFLKRFYSNNESKVKLYNLFEFYEANSKIFPNYCILPESRYLFKNIKKKQKMLDNIEEFAKETTHQNDTSSHHSNTINIFTTNIMDSLRTNNSQMSNTENSDSYQKIVRIMNENGVDDKVVNENKMNSTNKHKKFIKEINVKKENRSRPSDSNIMVNESVKSKMMFSSNVGNNKYIHKINIANIEKNIFRKKNTSTNSKSKSTSKTKATLTERTNVKHSTKGSNIHNNIIKSNIIVSSSIDVNKNAKTKEAKSMPKLSYKERLNSLNKLAQSSNINKRIISPQGKAIQYKNPNTGNLNNTKMKAIARTNITKQTKKIISTNVKPKSNITVKQKNIGYNVNIVKDKKIPSLHISFSKNFTSNNNNTKSKSKSKSKSPNSNSTSLNKKGNINVKNSCLIKQNNLRTLIHKDILASTEDGRHTERIKPSAKDKNINMIKTSLAPKVNKSTKNNSNTNLNNVNTHKKITSITSSCDYNKIHPKTARGNSNSIIANGKKNIVKDTKKVIHRIMKSNNYNHVNKNTVENNNKRVLSASTNKNGNVSSNGHKLLTSRGNSGTKTAKVSNTNNNKKIVKKIKNFNEAIKTVTKSTVILSPHNKSSGTIKRNHN